MGLAFFCQFGSSHLCSSACLVVSRLAPGVPPCCLAFWLALFLTCGLTRVTHRRRFAARNFVAGRGGSKVDHLAENAHVLEHRADPPNHHRAPPPMKPLSHHALGERWAPTRQSVNDPKHAKVGRLCGTCLLRMLGGMSCPRRQTNSLRILPCHWPLLNCLAHILFAL